ncbi:MAG: flagellar motor protein, partial [Moorea sp. SIO3E2]|nr:flagellar motor protein [Moorena sp. SIO3E2]
RENAELRAKAVRVDQLERGVAIWRARAKRSTDRQKALEQQVRALQVQIAAAPKPPDTPPIIVIKDQGAYRFDSGSAEIPSAMKDYIRQQIVPAIESNAKDYEINVVELIGHTDGQPNLGAGNIDQTIGNVVNKNSSISQLRPGSNADLGLMRALAVVQLLREIQSKEGRLKGLQFRAYSAAQLILPNGKIAPISLKDDQTRRRIEIRFTRLGKVTNVQ